MSEIRPVFAESITPLKLMVVIVLYRIAPTDSPAFQSVMAARRAWLEGAMRRVLVPGEREMPTPAAVAMLRLADEGAAPAMGEGDEDE